MAKEELKKPEGSPEKGKPETTEIPFQKGIEWQVNVKQVIEKSLGDKYQERIDGVFKFIDDGWVRDNSENIKSIELTKAGVLRFKDGKKILKEVYIAGELKDTIRERYEHSTDIEKRRARRERERTVAPPSRRDTIGRIMDTAEEDVPGKKTKVKAKVERERTQAAREETILKKLEPSKRTLSKEEAAAVEKLQVILSAKKAQRDRILSTVETVKDEEYDFSANVSPTIQDDDEEFFRKHWPAMDFSHEIDDLFVQKPKVNEGYQTNPFKELGWKPDTLRDLMQERSNERLYFQEVADAIFNDRVDDFSEGLKKKGISEKVTDLLDDEDLVVCYRKFKQLELDTSRPDVSEIALVTKILGDYMVYAHRLVNLVSKLKYNPAKETQDRERTVREYERNPDGTEIDNSSNHVKTALDTVFIKGVDSPTEYTSELAELFGTSDRPINFEDLNGRTATVEGEWFTIAQSPDAAYASAFTEIVQQKQNPDGTWVETVDEKDAVTHLNDLLKLGIAAYNALPADETLKEIVDNLNEENAIPTRWSGDPAIDLPAMYEALALTDLKELKKEGSDKDVMINEYRRMFMQVGSVVFQKNKFNKQMASAGESDEDAELKEKGVGLKFKPEQAEEIVAKLREAGIDETRLAKIKSSLLGGAAVVLPNYGGGFSLHYEFDQGTMIDITAMFPQWDGFAPGAAIGQKFQISEKVKVTIHAGGGVAAVGGWMAGAGGSISKEFDDIDGSVQVSAGLLGGVIPMGSVGVAANWAKSNEKFRETLSKKVVENHIAEVDATGKPYETVKENRSKYPALARILNSIEATQGLDEASKKQLFETSYEMFKEGIQKEAIDDSTKTWYERFLPTGVGLGVAMVGPVPVPYAYLEFQLWSRNLVYRVATDVEDVEQVTDEQARRQILAARALSKGKTEFIDKKLATSGELIFDPKTEQLKLKRTGEGKIDFSHLNNFDSFRDTLSRDAKIFVEPVKGLGEAGDVLQLKPKEAYGNIEVYIDPALGNDVVLTSQGGRLFVSVKKDREIYIKREDISFPFEHRGAVEETVIVITDNPYKKPQLIKDTSTVYYEQQPKKEWKLRPRSAVQELPELKGTPQENLKTWEEYSAWAQENKSERIKFFDAEPYVKSFDRLRDSVSLTLEGENSDLRIRPEVMQKVEGLKKDKAFIQEFRRLTTEGYELLKRKGRKDVHVDWEPSFPALSRKLKEKLGQDINAEELNAATYELLVTSFMDIQSKGPAKAKQEYLGFLESFERPMLTSIFKKYYEGRADQAQKTKEAVNWTINHLKDVDVTRKSGSVKEGTMFATLVGMGGITGMRRMYNFHETDAKYGVLGLHELDPKKTDVTGEVADFWMKKLSPYIRGMHNKEFPPREKAQEYAEFQRKLQDNLRSPLALKLVPVLGLMLSPAEMDALAAIHEQRADSDSINETNIAVVKKFLNWCDKVRAAELDGAKKVDLGGGYSLTINTRLAMGVYKKCGNISGLLEENFELFYKGTKKMPVFAGMGEGTIDVKGNYGRADFTVMAGAALPIIRRREIRCEEDHDKDEPKPEPPPDEPPPDEPPPDVPPDNPPPDVPPDTPPDNPPPDVPPTTETAQPEPAPAPGDANVGGTETGTVETGTSSASNTDIQEDI